MRVDGALVTTWTSSGTTAGFESIDLSGTSGSVIDVVGVLGDSEWLSIIEVSVEPCLWREGRGNGWVCQDVNLKESSR